MGVHPLLNQKISARPTPSPFSDHMQPDLQLHLNSRGGLKPSFGRKQINSDDLSRVSPISPLRSSSDSFGFKDCWSSSSSRNSPHSDTMENNGIHSGDDSGFSGFSDNASNASNNFDDVLDDNIFNQIASLRLET